MQISGAQQQAATASAKERAAEEKLDSANAAAQAATAQLAPVQSSLDAANAQVATLNSQVAAMKQQLVTFQNAPTPPPTPTGVPQDQYDKVNAALKDAQAQIDELNTVKETLSNKEKDAESRADDLQKVVDHYKGSVLRNGLQGEVLAYNPGWNFVVISIGDHQGAVANAEMILQRGGSQIGKIRITEVEPSTSVADVIPGSLARGVRVQPGDLVIFPGS
jgi:hypothetical protein